MNYAYLRQMPDNNNMSEQQRNILSFSLAQDLEIDKEVVEYSSKNHLIEDRKKFEEFMHSLEEGSSLIVDTLSVLSNRAEELIKIINCMLSHRIDLYIAQSKTRINKKTTIVEIFPLLNDLREAQKAKSNQIGRPKGSRSSSKFDSYQPQIISFLKEGMNVSAIARELSVSRSSLKDYIESRGIRELVEGSWMEINQPQKNAGVDNTILVCPFEQEQKERIS
ncbi:MAG: recombinase family protein [Sulfurovum sp.]|nr:recombinase family protein [Sulfurovum sp.]